MEPDALAAALNETKNLQMSVGIRMRSAANGWILADDTERITSVEASDGLVRVEMECKHGPSEIQVIDPAEVAVVYWSLHSADHGSRGQDSGARPEPGHGAYL
jgi:hypothetical protein